MRFPSPLQRGMALVMAMIVIVLITLLVAGAISFTGTERIAAQHQVREDSLSSCAQSARNLFLARIRALEPLSTSNIEISQPLGDAGVIATGHFTGTSTTDAGVALTNVRWVPATEMGGSRAGSGDISNGDTDGSGTVGRFAISARCIDPNTGVEREIEFLVRVGG